MRRRATSSDEFGNRAPRRLLAAGGARRIAALVVALAVIGVVAPAAGATTGPTPYKTVNVRITDKRITLRPAHANNVAFVLFKIRNLGKKRHDLVVGGEHTAILKPGKRAVFAVTFSFPGVYEVTSGVNKVRHIARLHITHPIRPD